MNTASVPTNWSSNVSCKGCNISNTDRNPVINYQNQQRIWNTVRVNSSLYLLNKGALSGYEPPKGQQVNWNQMSDRLYPHIQYAIPSRGNSTKRTLTRARPGACSPGGIGCDVKHDSYDRYLNRLKGRVLKKGYISPEITNFIACGGTPPFDPSRPMYGGKYYNTQIIPSCKCPGDIVIKCPELPRVDCHVDKCVNKCLFDVGDLISWKKCVDNVYGEVVSVLDVNTLYVQQLNKYGEPISADVVKVRGIKRIDESCFLMREDIPNEYFEKAIDLKYQNLREKDKIMEIKEFEIQNIEKILL